jgi:hypothetical protein
VRRRRRKFNRGKFILQDEVWGRSEWQRGKVANKKKGECGKNGTCCYLTCATSRANKSVRDGGRCESEMVFDDGRLEDLRGKHVNANETSDERGKKMMCLHASPVGIFRQWLDEIFDQSGMTLLIRARRVRRWKYVQKHPFSVAVLLLRV